MLERLRAKLGVQASETLAVGDGINDLEMLAWAAHGVAMGHSPAQVLAAADSPERERFGLVVTLGRSCVATFSVHLNVSIRVARILRSQHSNHVVLLQYRSVAFEFGVRTPSAVLKSLRHLSDLFTGLLEARGRRIGDPDLPTKRCLALIVARGVPEESLDNLQVECIDELSRSIHNLCPGLVGRHRVGGFVVERVHGITS